MKSLIPLILILLLTGCNQTVQFQINGTVPTNYHGTIRLSQYGSSWFDSKWDTIENGKFYFDGTIRTPEQFILIYEKDGPKGTFEAFSFFLDPSDNVSIILFPDSITKSIIKGSKIADEFSQVEKSIETDYEANSSILIAEYQEATKSGNTTQQTKIKNKIDSISQEITDYKLSYIKGNPDSHVSLYLLNSIYLKTDPEIVKQYFEILDSDLSNSKYYHRIDSYLSLLPGNPYLDFKLTDGKGRLYSLSELAENKVVLLDFWASWCQPCREQNALLSKLYERYKSLGFEIVGISLDRDTSVFFNTIAEDNMNWINLLDRTEGEPVNKTYETGSIPSNILIDKDGIIQYRDVNIDDLELTIIELLK